MKYLGSINVKVLGYLEFTAMLRKSSKIIPEE
jgi:hypothetical protein